MLIYSVQIFLFEWLGKSGTPLLPLSHDVSTVNRLLPGLQMSVYSESYRN